MAPNGPDPALEERLAWTPARLLGNDASQVNGPEDSKAEAAVWSNSGDSRDVLTTAATTFEADYRVSPSHGENRGSSPLGSANNYRHLGKGVAGHPFSTSNIAER